jgi:uncharacterized protein YaaQ
MNKWYNLYINMTWKRSTGYMKLIIAIIHDDDSAAITKELNLNGFSVTKLCSTGGFLKAGNTTLLIGVEKLKVSKAVEIIGRKSKSRKSVVNNPYPGSKFEKMPMSYPFSDVSFGSSGSYDGADDMDNSFPVEVDVKGATVFVLNVEQFIKL